MSEKLRVAVLFGGASTEYEVSLASATSIFQQIDRSRYEVFAVGITRDGQWLLYEGPTSGLMENTWPHPSNATPVTLSPDRTVHGMHIWRPTGAETVRLDAVFPVLHGKNGEDGTVQGLFELAGIPYVGAGVLSSALCMDKAVAHTLFEHAGLLQAKFQVVYPRDMERLDELEPILQKHLGYPMFVKPANAGSSVGVTKIKDAAALRPALALAFTVDRKAVVEEAVVGDEVECAVIGNDNPVASIPGELISNNEFYDYNAKYIDNATEFYIPARLEPEVAEKVRTVAVSAYRTLCCEGLARVDFFVRKSDRAVVLNEINTMPGFTTISMYPKLMIETGMSYTALIDELIRLAIRRAESAPAETGDKE